MAKMTVISHRGRIRGIFTQKKKLWDIMDMDELSKDLIIALNGTKFSVLNYSRMCKYLKERGILQIYDADDISPGLVPADVKCSYILWDIETNTFYDPELPDALKEPEGDETIFREDDDIVAIEPDHEYDKYEGQPREVFSL